MTRNGLIDHDRGDEEEPAASAGAQSIAWWKQELVPRTHERTIECSAV